MSGRALALSERLLRREGPRQWSNLHAWLGSLEQTDVRVARHGHPPAPLGGTALCVGVDEYEEDRFQFPRIGSAGRIWGAALSAREASGFLRDQGMRTHVLTGGMATRGAILNALRALLKAHDPETPFLLWLSGLAFGHGARSRFLPWDTGWDHPLGRAIDMGGIHAMLRGTPHWGLVLDTAWPDGECPGERLGLVQRLHPLPAGLLKEPVLEAGPDVRTALLVAMSETGHPEVPELPSAARETAALADVFRGPLGFDAVELLENPTEEEVLERAGVLAARAGIHGLFAFSFLGHGVRDMASGQGHLLCRGADPTHRRGTGLLPLHRLMLRTIKAGGRALLLDVREGLQPRLGTPSLHQVPVTFLEDLMGPGSAACLGIGALVMRGMAPDSGIHLRRCLGSLGEGASEGAFSQDLVQDLDAVGDALDSASTVEYAGYELPGFAAKAQALVAPPAPIRVGLTPTSDFALLQPALDAAPPGAVIHLAPGHYRECLVIRKSVTVVGLGAPAGVYLFLHEGNGIQVEAPGVTFRDLVFVEEGERDRRATEPHAAIRVTEGSLRLERCELHANSHAGLLVSGIRVSAVLEDCKIEGALETGVLIEKAARADLSRCDIAHCRNCGLELRWVGAAHLKEVRIFGRRMTGISVRSGAKVEVDGGMIFPSDDCGVLVAEDGEAFLQGCRFSDSASVGVLLKDQARAMVRGCSFSPRGGHRPWHAEPGTQGMFDGNRLL